MAGQAERRNNRAPSYDCDCGRENHDAWTRELSRLIDADKNASVLDAGADKSLLSLKLAALGYNVTASGIAGKGLKEAEQKAKASGLNVRYVHPESEAMPFEADSFDYVVSRRALSLSEKPMEALHDWVRVLRPGGKVLVLLQVMQEPEGRDKRSQAPLFYATPTELETAIIKAGLLDVSTELLPKDMTLGDSRRWYAFSGRKPITIEEKKQAIANRWSRQSADFCQVHGPENDPGNLTVWRQTLERFIGLSGKGKTLDIGTGTGFLSVMAAELGYDSTGIDLTREMLAFARENSDKRGVNVTLRQADGDKLPFADCTFDIVMNCRVLWAMLDPVASMQEWLRAVRPGGKILSFARMDRNPSEAGSSMLPMERASVEKYLVVYRKAGCVHIGCEWLSDIHILIPGPPWIVFYGEKAWAK